MRYPKSIIYLACILYVSCATRSLNLITVRLGDSESRMRKKMNAIGAKDVTNKSDREFGLQTDGFKKHYLWELSDSTIVMTLLMSPSPVRYCVVVVEASQPGCGVKGIESWSMLRDTKKLKKLTNKGTFEVIIDQERWSY